MSAPTVVPEHSHVTVAASGPLEHACPHVDEVDRGTVTVTWSCVGATIELHSLAEYLAGFVGARISHEEITHVIRGDLAALDGICDVRVETTWTTGGLAVRVRA